MNAATVIVGSLLGLLLHRSFPERFRQIQFQATGLFTLALGLQMAVRCENPLTLVFSLLVGGLAGEALGLEAGADRLATRLRERLGGTADGTAGAEQHGHKFSEGLVTAFLIFCIGPMTILGALDEGIRGEHALLLTKSLLDGFTSMALASTYGIGVLFSVLPLLLFQGAITGLGYLFGGQLSEHMVLGLTSAGGVLILGLGLNLLGVAKIRVMNLLPALVFAVLFAAFGK